MSTLGWKNFDQDVVEAIRRRADWAVDVAADGSLKSPIVGDEGRLAWADGDYTNGTVPHPERRVRFHVSPTYIHENPLANFITGHELIEEAIAGDWGKAETTRLGHENSEDALSWNVFRSLQEAGELRWAFTALSGVECREEPALVLWGRRILESDTAATPELEKALNELEGDLARQTEPDIVLHSPDAGWLLIEAKLGSPARQLRGKPDKLARWITRYTKSSGVFTDALAADQTGAFPEQILRNVAVASRLGPRATVVALVRRKDAPQIEETVGRYLRPDSRVGFRRATWQALHADLPVTDDLADLRDYLENKSVGLRPAFDLGS